MKENTEIFNVTIEDDKQDEDIVPVVPPVQQDNDLETSVPVVKHTRFQLSEDVRMLDEILRRKQNWNKN